MTIEDTLKYDVAKLVAQAADRCQQYLTPTPLEYSRSLSEKIDGEVWLKLDSMQRTASFKFRGAINKILSLTDEDFDKGVVTASTGNFALAMGEAMKLVNRSATLVVSRNIPKVRLDLLKAQGVLDVVMAGDDAGATEVEIY